MPQKKPGDISAKARAAFMRMSDEERKAVTALLQRAVAERDLPKFKAGLAKLGFDETSRDYERLLQLWDEHARASRR